MIADNFRGEQTASEGNRLSSIQEVADTLASEIHLELALRNITAESSGERVKAHLHSVNGAMLIEPNDLFQVVAYAPKCTQDRLVAFKPTAKLVEPWAKELAIKLARPFPLTTYPLELPHGVYEAALGQHCGIQVRVISDYIVHIDAFVYRFDVLCRWAEPS